MQTSDPIPVRAERVDDLLYIWARLKNVPPPWNMRLWQDEHSVDWDRLQTNLSRYFERLRHARPQR